MRFESESIRAVALVTPSTSRQPAFERNFWRPWTCWQCRHFSSAGKCRHRTPLRQKQRAFKNDVVGPHDQHTDRNYLLEASMRSAGVGQHVLAPIARRREGRLLQDVAAVAGDDATAQQLAAEGAGGRHLAQYVPSATASWRLNLLRSGNVPDSLLASIRCRWRPPPACAGMRDAQAPHYVIVYA